MSLTILGHMKVAVVAQSPFSSKCLNCTWDVKSTSQNKIIDIFLLNLQNYIFYLYFSLLSYIYVLVMPWNLYFIKNFKYLQIWILQPKTFRFFLGILLYTSMLSNISMEVENSEFYNHLCQMFPLPMKDIRAPQKVKVDNF